MTINPNNEDLIRLVESTLDFYGGVAASAGSRRMAERVLCALAAEQDRQRAAEIEAQYRYEQSRRETAAILGRRVDISRTVREEMAIQQSRAAMAGLDLRVAHFKATREVER